MKAREKGCPLSGHIPQSTQHTWGGHGINQQWTPQGRVWRRLLSIAVEATEWATVHGRAQNGCGGGVRPLLTARGEAAPAHCEAEQCLYSKQLMTNMRFSLGEKVYFRMKNGEERETFHKKCFYNKVHFPTKGSHPGFLLRFPLCSSSFLAKKTKPVATVYEIYCIIQ